MEKSDRKEGQKVFIIAQELELIRMLAGNEEKTRNKALKNLSKWLLRRSTTMPFTEEDFQRIWKGLYFCMWTSDKPLVQEECADKISKLVHFPHVSTALLFFKAGLYILSQEWSGIQQLRLDKFLMLVRRLLRETLNVLKNNKFSKSSIQGFSEVLSETVLNNANNTPVGLFMHFVEIFLEELAKVSNGKLQSNLLLDFIMPFIKCLATLTDGRQIGHLRKYIFTYLIIQSKLGLEYQEKYNAWRQQGFPGSINSMQKIKLDKPNLDKEIITERPKEINQKPLDPRAGRVDVEIPQINFKPQEIANALLQYKFDAHSSAQSRTMIRTLVEQFTKLAKGVYPLGIKEIDVKDKNEDINIRKAAIRLIKFDQKIMGKKNKKRKLDKENDEVLEKKPKKIKITNELDMSSTNKEKVKIKKVKEQAAMNGDSNKGQKIKKKNKLKQPKEVQSEITLSNDNIDFNKNKKLKSDKNHKHEASQKSNKIKNKPLTLIDDTKVKSNIIKAKNKVQKNTNKTLNNSKEENIECIFERNSGTWVVYELNSSENTGKLLKSKSTMFSPAKSSKSPGKHDFHECKVLDNQFSPNISANNKFLEQSLSLNDSPKLGMAPVKLFEASTKKKEIFPKSDWDEPLQEGEYEICIPSKKHINKLKKKAKHQDISVHELINTTLKKIKGKSRLSLDSRLVNNPFMKQSSSKKVKINTKLNKSQEMHEHYSSIKSSPGIPFDASRKPAKPLLKPVAFSTPINPFYKKQLNI